MRGLFAKIFLGFWIAQSLTFLISTVLILRRQFVRPTDLLNRFVAERQIAGLELAIQSAGRLAANVQKTQSVADAAEGGDRQIRVRGATETAADNHVQFEHAQIQQACRTQLRTGTPFRKRGNPNICRYVRRS